MRFLIALLLLATLQEPDTRTFVFVREHGTLENIQDAKVKFTDPDGQAWVFPPTNEGGWTKLQIPDGRYDVIVKATGWKTRDGKLLVPARSRYPPRTFVIYMERS
jgi:hypothetical protein